MFDAKTIFLLNHTAYFQSPSGNEILIDASASKSNPAKTIYNKSIWSNLVDSVIQYCRVIFDIFSCDKPISIITFDTEEKIHSIWLEEDQKLETLWHIFSQEGPPCDLELDMTKCFSLPGLSSAVSMLRMLTAEQKQQKASLENAGRVIVLSNFSKKQVQSWIPEIVKQLDEAVNSSEYSSVTASEWLFIDVYRTDEEVDSEGATYSPVILESDNTASSPHRFLYHRLSGDATSLYRGLMRLAEDHFQLSSTLVQDIPMKEETSGSSASASTNSSTMYGVELLHPAGAHHLLQRVQLAERLYVISEPQTDSSSKIKPLQPNYMRSNSGFSKTLGIKWVTPKSSDGALLRYASAAYRVTLADVGNRASTCLTQFVLGGRSVALAHRLANTSAPALPTTTVGNLPPGITGNEALLLTCHGSVMYLHELTTMCPLAHPPPIELGGDNAVSSNFRLQQFINHIIRPSRLAPASARLSYAIAPKQRAQQHLERSTRYWPVLESETYLGASKLSTPLFEHLPKEYLEPIEFNSCKEAILSLIIWIKNSLSLCDTTTTSSSSKRSAIKRLPVDPSLQAEAIATALELDHLLSLYANLSAEHEQLLAKVWRNAIGGSSSSFTPGTQVTVDNLSSLPLGDLVLIARRISTGQCCSPEVLVKAVRQMTLLCRQMQLSVDRKECAGDLGSQTKNKKDRKRQNVGPERLVIENADLTAFFDFLDQNKRRRSSTNPKKLDFTGVSTADPKGFCQLYRSLREKEKSAT